MASLDDYGLGRRELTALERPSVRVAYIVGDVGTGKSTLAAAVARHLSRRGRTALVDLDAGQASVGLPTTFAWRTWGRRAAKPGGMYFTGTTSPTGHFDIAIAGAAAMVSEARDAAAKIVVDTCGLARGPAGIRLHHTTIDAVRPDAVLAIQRGDELAGLLEPLRRMRRPVVIDASVPEGVCKRSRATRRSYRRERFGAYFARARERVFGLDEVGLLRPRRDPVGRIASLRNEAGRDVALGIVRAVGKSSGTITVLTPLPARTRVAAVVLGSMRIARDGRQLARDV